MMTSQDFSPVQPSDSRVHRESKKVLVIEDDTSIGKMIDQVLHEDGYKTVMASSLSESLALYYHGSFDGVLLDMILPDGSGKEFFDYFRNRNVPIVVVTVLSRERVAYILGTKDFMYVSKPFDLDSFRRLVTYNF